MESGGTIVYGGKSDESSRYISPTLITDITMEDRIMKVRGGGGGGGLGWKGLGIVEVRGGGGGVWVGRG